MTKNNKNWTKIDPEILRFGELSGNQRYRGIQISHNEAYVRCLICNHEKKVTKTGNHWDLGAWQVCLEKATVRKDDRGYFIGSSIRFYCAHDVCLKALELMTLSS